MPILNKDMTLCISLAGRPSNIGTRFHNYLYDALGLNFIYKAFTTADLPAAIAGIRGLGIRGASISMPFKQAVIPLIDELDESARTIDSVNTIVNDGGRLHAYNTDYIAVRRLLEQHEVAPCPVVVRGAGGMAQAVVAALKDSGFDEGTVVARTERSGRELADRYGYNYVPDVAGLGAELIVNATPIGMAGGPEADDLAFPTTTIEAARVVFDVVAIPAATPLLWAAEQAGKTTIAGTEVIAAQAEEQFVLYTGIRPDPELVAAASAFSREV